MAPRFILGMIIISVGPELERAFMRVIAGAIVGLKRPSGWRVGQVDF